ITSLGAVTFRKTLFTNKETGHSEYLLDRILGLGEINGLQRMPRPDAERGSPDFLPAGRRGNQPDCRGSQLQHDNAK
ncbi:hypothetical protein, partial [Hungatella effluvii]|uniref:hypothetical protein n=1 Tax=Hungatella effluvii TaxID=1096246 RepID=UPI001FA8B570